MGAAIVMDPILTRFTVIHDMRVTPRHGFVDAGFVIGEGNLVSANETVPMIANLGAPSNVDSCRPEGFH